MSRLGTAAGTASATGGVGAIAAGLLTAGGWAGAVLLGVLVLVPVVALCWVLADPDRPARLALLLSTWRRPDAPASAPAPIPPVPRPPAD